MLNQRFLPEFGWLAGVLVGCVLGTAGAQDVVDLTMAEGVGFQIQAKTLQVKSFGGGAPEVLLSRGLPASGEVESLRTVPRGTAWRLPHLDLDITATTEGHRLRLDLRRGSAGTLGWPVIPLASARGLVLPAFEGVYVRSDDVELVAWLRGQGAMSATAELSMPFLGLDLGAVTATCILPEPYYDTVAATDSVPPDVRVTHTWTPNRLGSAHRVVFEMGEAGLLAPALAYRRWLLDRGELLSLDRKIAANPAVAKLLGAPHAYLWGSSYLTPDDVPRRKWKALAEALAERAAAAPGGFSGLLVGRLSAAGHQHLTEIVAAEYPSRYAMRELTSALSVALTDRSLSDQDTKSPPAAVAAANGQILARTFPGLLADPATWGGGASIALLDKLRAAGLERLLLCTSDLDDASLKPRVVARAADLGYLFGPYDSYHSVHSPDAHPDASWTTAQFDRELFETGAVVGLDGKKSAGFKQRGHHLSPLAARPWVEQRVDRRCAAAPFSAWFVDCDAFGQFFDDTHPDHVATRLDDAAARRARLRWMSERHGLVVGSEGGSAVMTSAIHFGHGVMTPVFGWGDRRLKDRESEFCLGRYWPPDAPTRFFASVPLHPAYQRPYFDPRDRLPLYQAVFGDCVVATHHWGYASHKFADQLGTTQLLELLYDVPPLYHLNRESWPRRRDSIVRHYRFWSPIHRALGTRPLIDFEHLSEDRLVQRTTFAGSEGPVRITANFATEPRPAGGPSLLPPRSATVTGPIDLEQRSFTVREGR